MSHHQRLLLVFFSFFKRFVFWILYRWITGGCYRNTSSCTYPNQTVNRWSTVGPRGNWHRRICIRGRRTWRQRQSRQRWRRCIRLENKWTATFIIFYAHGRPTDGTVRLRPVAAVAGLYGTEADETHSGTTRRGIRLLFRNTPARSVSERFPCRALRNYSRPFCRIYRWPCLNFEKTTVISTRKKHYTNTTADVVRSQNISR